MASMKEYIIPIIDDMFFGNVCKEIKVRTTTMRKAIKMANQQHFPKELLESIRGDNYVSLTGLLEKNNNLTAEEKDYLGYWIEFYKPIGVR